MALLCNTLCRLPFVVETLLLLSVSSCTARGRIQLISDILKEGLPRGSIGEEIAGGSRFSHSTRRGRSGDGKSNIALWLRYSINLWLIVIKVIKDERGTVRVALQNGFSQGQGFDLGVERTRHQVIPCLGRPPMCWGIGLRTPAWNFGPPKPPAPNIKT